MYNGNAMYGRALMDAVHQLIPTFGRIFLVVSSSDASEERYDRLKEVFVPDTNGQIRVFTSVSDAYDACTSNNNDVVLIDGDSTHSLTAMLTVSKNRVNFIGMDGSGRAYGQGAKVSLGVTTAATDIGTIKNTGVRNSYRNIKFMNSNTVTEGIYCLVDGGEYAYYENCEFYKETDLDQTGAAEIVANGDSSYFKHCTIGSLANVISGTIIRPNVTLVKELAGTGLVMRDNTFEDCLFWRQSSHANNRFIYSAADVDVERLLLFKGCGFINAANSAGTPAQAISGVATFTVGAIVCDPLCYATKVTKLSTTTGVFVSGAAPNSGSGISVNAA